MHITAVYLDGIKDAEQTVSARIPTHPLGEWSNEGPLFLGSYPPDGLGCDGELGPVLISHAARTIEGAPASFNFPSTITQLAAGTSSTAPDHNMRMRQKPTTPFACSTICRHSMRTTGARLA